MQLVQQYWYVAWGLFVAVALVVFLLRRRPGPEPWARRLIFAAFPSQDPAHDRHDSGMVGRQLRLILFAAPLVGLALLIAWVLGSA